MSEVQRKTLLLVEDEAILAMTEKMQLEKYGYAIKTVSTGEKAVEAVNTFPEIDLVLMDINLGDGIDGTQAAEIILRDHDMPIVFVSSHSEREVVEKTEKITSYGYVVKNSSITVLDASIKMAFKLFEEKRKKAEKEEEIKIKEDRLSKIMIAANDGMWDWNLQTNDVYFDPRYYKMSGYEVDEFPHTLEEFTKRIHPDDTEFVMAEAEKHLSGMTERFDIQFRFFKKNGEWQWIQGKGIVVERDLKGRPIRFIGTHRDITENKLLEISLQSKNEDYEAINEELRSTTEELQVQNEKLRIARDELLKSEKRFQYAMDATNDGLWDWNLETNGIYFSPRWKSILGYEDNEIQNNFSVWENATDPEDVKRTLELKEKLITRQIDRFVVEFKMKHKQGHWVDILSQAKAIFDENGKAIRIVGTHTDITESKRLEAKMVSQRWLYEQILEQSLAGYWDWHIPTGDEYFSPAFKKMFGYEDHEIENKADSWQKLIFVEDLPSVNEKFKMHVESKGQIPFRNEVRFHHKDGSAVWVICTGKVIEWDDDGKAKRVIGCNIDITEMKKAEESLRESELCFIELIRTYPLPMIVTDSKQDVEFYNDKFTELFGYTKNDVATFEHWMEKAYPDIEYRKRIQRSWTDAIEKALKEKSEMEMQVWDIVTKDKRIRTCEFYMKPLGKKNLILVNDITNRIVSENIAKNMLVEKELILKEVHHRIKNNMNTASSLLSLQANSVADSTVAMALKEAGNRIHSMSLLYDKLYQSSNFIEASVEDYLTSLVDEVIANFPNSNAVKIKKNIQNFILDAKRLQPLGIIINELLTNIMKYAFVGRESGLITVSATNVDGHVVVSVQDDGLGIPESVSFENSTGFGLQLVQALTQQMNGTIRIERGNGAKVVLEFEA